MNSFIMRQWRGEGEEEGENSKNDNNMECIDKMTLCERGRKGVEGVDKSSESDGGKRRCENSSTRVKMKRIQNLS